MYVSISANSEKVADEKLDVAQPIYAKPICTPHFLRPEDQICRTTEYSQHQLSPRVFIQLITILTILKIAQNHKSVVSVGNQNLEIILTAHNVMKPSASSFARLPDTTVLKNMSKLMKVLVTLSVVHSK